MAERTIRTRNPEVLTQAEVNRLCLSLAVASGTDGFSEETAERLVDWAAHVRMDAALLELVLKGDILVRWVGDDWEYRRANETEQGEIAAAEREAKG